MVGDLREGVRQTNDKNALQTVADGCVAVSYFFKFYGYWGQFTCHFFWGGSVRTKSACCEDLDAEGRGEPREPHAHGPRRKWWMLNPLSVHWCWSCLWTGFM